LHLARTLCMLNAQALTEKLCEAAVCERRALSEVVCADPQAGKALDDATLAELFDPQSCLGSAPAMIELALAGWSAALKH